MPSDAINSDAQYRFARGVDPASVVSGLELATRMILDLCGGDASEIVLAGEAPARPAEAPASDAGVAEALNAVAARIEKIAQTIT